ncbi:MAG: AmmeMemoRadiSam system radical SAM enzyme [Candidatus Abyssobacteria bacterium SURF_5]|uniref:AmmeMemoRadiSam system radical SAM enzyme n=1 Tax=Abyssobacteria bacterium (strain SURF_5) TaxID=2093360 RepID=A0A3A4NSM6_ABYX5|nr:MAG: AmmeMemoRadiSam system radical SAM enzyme [Candidatus Abyssubacteria bacterium SURF_5]
MILRRDFLVKAGVTVAGVGGSIAALKWLNRGGKAQVSEVSAAGEAAAGESLPEAPSDIFVREAMHYKKLEEGKVECEVCPRACKVAPKERGYCGVRENFGGSYKTLVYGRACSINVDPIEKKPLFHFLPGARALSLATAGCNIECKFCQNWEISQFRPEQVRSIHFPPEAVVAKAIEGRIESIAFTYTEPVVFYEYMHDTAKLAKEKSIKSVMISNGYIKEKPMSELCEHLSAVKIDLKAFTEKFYSEMCSGKLQPVLDTLKLLKKKKMWFEVVVLIIPTLNDDPGEIADMCAWIVTELGPDVPIHFTRYHPTYKIKNLPPTPIRTLDRAREIARKAGLNYSYVGNVPGHEGESTYCPNCQRAVVRRVGFGIASVELEKGKCKHCGWTIAGVWT